MVDVDDDELFLDVITGDLDISDVLMLLQEI
jgi:hypothetical protein